MRVCCCTRDQLFPILPCSCPRTAYFGLSRGVFGACARYALFLAAESNAETLFGTSWSAKFIHGVLREVITDWSGRGASVSLEVSWQLMRLEKERAVNYSIPILGEARCTFIAHSGHCRKSAETPACDEAEDGAVGGQS